MDLFDALVFSFEFSPRDVMEMTPKEMAFLFERGNAYRKRQAQR